MISSETLLQETNIVHNTQGRQQVNQVVDIGYKESRPPKVLREGLFQAAGGVRIKQAAMAISKGMSVTAAALRCYHFSLVQKHEV